MQDKILRTNMRSEGMRAEAQRGAGVLALVAMLPITLYAFIIPMWLLLLLPSGILFTFLYVILFICLMLYAATRRKIIEKAFKKPRFLEF